MRSIVVFGAAGVISPLQQGNAFVEEVDIKGQLIRVGMVKGVRPRIDFGTAENAESVFVRVLAFSCNFRDQSFLFATTRNRSSNEYFCLGSDFVAEVLEVGAQVKGLRVGDRVIGNGDYSEQSIGKNLGGLPTNHGSREFQVLPQAKLVKIPADMPIEVAAAFTTGTQTTYSMLRKLNLKPKQRILITAAKSNTSLFAIGALRNFDAEVFATSTSGAFLKELRARGVKDVVLINPRQGDFRRLYDLVRDQGKFDAVIDPFFDLHLPGVLPAMKQGARYVTCGFNNQYHHQDLLGAENLAPKADLTPTMAQAMASNIQLIGNCLGLTKDLQAALYDYDAGKLEVIIDSVFTSERIGAFFARTYNAEARFGKVIYQYS